MGCRTRARAQIKDAFKTAGGVELAPGAGTKNYDEITARHDAATFDEMDLDADLSSQALLFAVDDDDALAGITVPDATDALSYIPINWSQRLRFLFAQNRRSRRKREVRRPS